VGVSRASRVIRVSRMLTLDVSRGVDEDMLLHQTFPGLSDGRLALRMRVVVMTLSSTMCTG
jgi:hypothetical protein